MYSAYDFLWLLIEGVHPVCCKLFLVNVMCIVLDKLTLVVLCVLRSSSKGENKYKLYYGPCSE